MPDPHTAAAIPEWVKLLIQSGVIGVVGTGIAAAFWWFIKRPVVTAETRALEAEKRERETAKSLQAALLSAERWKTRLKDEITDRVERRAVHDMLKYGRPSVCPTKKGEDDTVRILLKGEEVRRLDEEREGLELRERGLTEPPAFPLEAFGSKARLPAGAGQEDYAAMRRLNAQQGIPTPVEIRKKQPTLHDLKEQLELEEDREDGLFERGNLPRPLAEPAPHGRRKFPSRTGEE
jgi:hypothetical protein